MSETPQTQSSPRTSLWNTVLGESESEEKRGGGEVGGEQEGKSQTNSQRDSTDVEFKVCKVKRVSIGMHV